MKRSVLAITAITLAVLAGFVEARLSAQSAATQKPTPQSLEAMEAAGVKMSFDVASVKPNKSDQPGHNYSNVPLFGDAAPPPGGYFSATNITFGEYVMFAYDFGQAEMVKLLPQLPPWARNSRFDIQARAQGNPTRDQLRLMMQSLIADRFKLAFHTEIKQGPIYALVLTKPGKLGPHLQQHTDDAGCSSEPYDPRTPVPSGPSGASGLDLPALPCGLIVMLTPSVPGLVRFGGRGISLTRLLQYSSGDRPEIDRTGLSGTFDFDCEVAPLAKGTLPTDSQPDAAGETFPEAIQHQLGLKLEPQTGAVTTFVLDHIEEPSPN